jgi:tetratricopeptide (TPR) repeat protein
MDARERGGYDGELRYLDPVIERDPNNADAVAFRGSTYYQMGLHHEALGDFNRALELDPNHMLALLLRGSTWRMIGQYDLAARDLNKLLKLQPSDPMALKERNSYRGVTGSFAEPLLIPQHRWLGRAAEPPACSVDVVPLWPSAIGR